MNEPKQILIGDTATWTESLSDYTPANWDLYYFFQGPANGFNIKATASGSNYLMTINATESAKFAAGRWKFTAVVKKGTERHIIDSCSGYLTALANPETSTAVIESREFSQQVVDALKATILGRATKAQAAMQLGMKQVQYLTPSELRIELMRWEEILRVEIQKELLAEGLPAGGRMKVQFR